MSPIKLKIKPSAAKSQQMTKVIGRPIACGMHSYDVVEEAGFFDLINRSMPDYAVPSRITFSRAVNPEVYETEKKEVKNELGDIFASGVKCLSLTADIVPRVPMTVMCA